MAEEQHEVDMNSSASPHQITDHATLLQQFQDLQKELEEIKGENVQLKDEIEKVLLNNAFRQSISSAESEQVAKNTHSPPERESNSPPRKKQATAEAVEQNILKFDGEQAKKLEQWYSSPDVIRQRKYVLSLVKPTLDEHILDIGVGPAFLAQDMAMRVGENGLVHGIDISESMLELAKERCKEYNWLSLDVGDACKLSHPKKKKFDCVVSTQVYEYVSDIETALKEAFGVLKSGGRIVILDTDFDSVVWNSSDNDRMKQVLLAYDEHLVHPNLPKTLRYLLEKCGFVECKVEAYPMVNIDLEKDTYSYSLLSTIANFVVGKQGITDEVAQAWRKDLEELHKKHQYFFSLNRYSFVAYKP